MSTEKASPFEVSANSIFTIKNYDNETGNDCEKLKACMDKEYGIIELLIIKALYKYQILNRYNLERAIELELENRLKKGKYVSNIKALEKNGFVCQAHYGASYEESQKTTFYFLSTGSYEYMRKYYPRKPVTYLSYQKNSTIDFSKPAEIMERMSLNQWHINLLSNYKVKDEGYYGRRRFGLTKMWLRSHVRIRTMNGKYITIIAVPAAKSEEHLEDTIVELAKIGERASDAGKEAILIVILCDSISKIKHIADIISNKSDVQSAFLYAVDMNTAELPCLTNLYQIKRDNHVITLENYEVGICCEEKS